MKGNKTMKQLFDTPQLKEGTYRAFIWEPGHAVAILNDGVSLEDACVVSSEDFYLNIYNELFDYQLLIDRKGGSKAIERMVKYGCEEVLV